MIDDILVDVDDEYMRATSRFGKFHSAHEGYAVILEELEELKTEVFKHREERDLARMRKEAIRIASMACRFITDVIDEGGEK